MLQTLTSELELWREETFTGDAEVSLQMNFFPPVQQVLSENTEAETSSDSKETVSTEPAEV